MWGGGGEGGGVYSSRAFGRRMIRYGAFGDFSSCVVFLSLRDWSLDCPSLLSPTNLPLRGIRFDVSIFVSAFENKN